MISLDATIHAVLYNALHRMADGVRDTSEHKTAEPLAAVNRLQKRAGAQLQCQDCERVWRHYLDIAVLDDIVRQGRIDHPPAFRGVKRFMFEPEAEKVIHLLTPTMARALETPCWHQDSLGKSAQWITERVRNSGPRGILLTSLLRMAADLRICPPDRTLYLLRHMGFTPPGPVVPAVIRLPSSHPMRLWGRDLPNPEDGNLDESVLQALSLGEWWPV